MLNDARQATVEPDTEITVGADKGYDAQEFIQACLEMKVTPHVAQNTSAAWTSRACEPSTRLRRKASAQCCRSPDVAARRFARRAARRSDSARGGSMSCSSALATLGRPGCASSARSLAARAAAVEHLLETEQSLDQRIRVDERVATLGRFGFRRWSEQALFDPHHQPFTSRGSWPKLLRSRIWPSRPWINSSTLSRSFLRRHYARLRDQRCHPANLRRHLCPLINIRCPDPDAQGSNSKRNMLCRQFFAYSG